jgi:3-oxoacyl-[acyl-carrier protein] reductase
MENKDKIAIVTGSSSGLGAAVAIGLAKKNVNVVINYSKNKEEALKVQKICDDYGVKTLCIRANVSDDNDCRHLVEETIKKFNKVDVLVNNAGTTKFANHQNLEALSDEDFIDIYKVNVIGPYQMTRAVEPHMKKNKFGSIVNVSSIAGITGIGSSIAYAASKGALNTMTLSLAKALGPEIRVNTVCPGFIGTGWFLDRFGEEKFNKIIKNQEEITPLKRAGTPEDIAKSVIFFCLEGGEHITGELLVSDAGMHLSLPR